MAADGRDGERKSKRRRYDLSNSDEVRQMLFEQKQELPKNFYTPFRILLGQPYREKTGWRQYLPLPTREELREQQKAMAEGRAVKGVVIERPLHPAVDRAFLFTAAAMGSALACAPLDQAKLLIQCRTELYPQKPSNLAGVSSTIRHVARTMGPRYLWRGANPRVFDCLVAWPLVEICRQSNALGTLLMTAIASAFLLPVQFPLQYARQRLAMDVLSPGRPYFMSSFHTWREAISSRGWGLRAGGLYHGALTMWLSLTIYRTGLFSFANGFSELPATWLAWWYSRNVSPLSGDLNWAQRNGLTNLGTRSLLQLQFIQRQERAQQLLFGPSLVFITALAYPFDTVARRIMANTAPNSSQLHEVAAADASGASVAKVMARQTYDVKYTSARECFQTIVRSEGIKGLYKGFVPHVLGVAAFIATLWAGQVYANTEESRRYLIRMARISEARAKASEEGQARTRASDEAQE